jgi:zinc-ribbon domain
VNKVDDAVAELERCAHCGASIDVYATTCPACGRDLVADKRAAFERLRASGAISQSVFDAMDRLLDVDQSTAPTGSPIRKQVTDLVPADLERFPIWEFALDEEGEPGQDETSVRPRPDLERADPSDGLFIVKAEFVAADGTRFYGFVSPHYDPHVAYTQPTIVTNAGHVNFWFGFSPPRTDLLDAAYRTLEKDRSALFPVRYRAVLEHGGAALVGELPAFLHYRSSDDRTVVETR